MSDIICAANGCVAFIPKAAAPEFACPDHWNRLSSELRGRIVRAYDEGTLADEIQGFINEAWQVWEGTH